MEERETDPSQDKQETSLKISQDKSSVALLKFARITHFQGQFCTAPCHTLPRYRNTLTPTSGACFSCPRHWETQGASPIALQLKSLEKILFFWSPIDLPVIIPLSLSSTLGENAKQIFMVASTGMSLFFVGILYVREKTSIFINYLCDVVLESSSF